MPPLTHQSEANVQGDAQDLSQTIPGLQSATSALEILKTVKISASSKIYFFSFYIRLLGCTVSVTDS